MYPFFFISIWIVSFLKEYGLIGLLPLSQTPFLYKWWELQELKFPWIEKVTSRILFLIISSNVAVTSSVITGGGLTLCSKSRSTSRALFLGLFAAVTYYWNCSLKWLKIIVILYKVRKQIKGWLYLSLHGPRFWLQVCFLHHLYFRLKLLKLFLMSWKIFRLLYMQLKIGN